MSALLLAASAAQPVLAQVTLRIDPVPVVYGSTTGVVTSFDIFMDGVPAAGLGSFRILLNEDDPSDITKCLTFVGGTLDPDLATAWGTSNSTVSVSNDVLTWTAAATSPGRSAPGTVKLGTVSYRITVTPPGPISPCAVGAQHNFLWDGTSQWSTGLTANMPFDILQGAPWVIGAPPDVDLTATCTRVAAPNDDPNTFDPNTFVDGDTIRLNCTAMNLGTANSGASLLRAFFSINQSLDSSDFEVTSVDLLSIQGGSSLNAVLSAAPPFTSAGMWNLCTKIDVNRDDVNDVDGLVLETDETNNTECRPITVLTSRKDLVVVPSSIVPTPSPVDPNAFHAGLLMQIAYDIRNQGIGAVRPPSYRNTVHLGTSLTAIQNNPTGTRICSKLQQLGGSVPFHKGGTILNQTYGLETAPADPDETCLIRFTQAPGNYILAVRTDANNNVTEEDPNGASAPAEGNNWASVPITVEAPLPPQVRVREDTTGISDLHINVYDPPSPGVPGRAAISLISVQNIAAYSLRMTWSPANLATIDPNTVLFTDFLQENGRVQTCGIDNLDLGAGILDVSCTTLPGSDPNLSNAGATTEGNAKLLTVTFTAAAPGMGTIALSDLMAATPSGATIMLTAPLGSTFEVTGDPHMSVKSVTQEPTTTLSGGPIVNTIVPGVAFQTKYILENTGFGAAPVPVPSRLVLSQDAMTDPEAQNPEPDVIACSVNEPSAFPPKSTLEKVLTTCRLLDDTLPGLYTGFYQVGPFAPGLDPNTQQVISVQVPSRVVALRKSGKGRQAETFIPPDQLNGVAEGPIAATSKLRSQGISIVGSEARTRNWMVGLRKTKSGPSKLLVQPVPKLQGEVLDALTKLRLPKQTRAVLGSVDVDEDHEGEIILLRSSKKEGEWLEFRRVDFKQRKPLICQAAAATDPAASPFGASVVDAAGIEYDGTLGDELAVVTADGVLTIFDISLSGSPPPPDPCKPVPTIIESPADMILVPLASDTAFSTSGDTSLSICVIDFLLDGSEEIVSLHEDGSGLQALRVFDVPATLGGTVTLLADDPAFGGTSSRAKAMGIACTR